jgi:hypothetical protein
MAPELRELELQLTPGFGGTPRSRLVLSVSYTYAHSLDDVSAKYDPAIRRGRMAFDVRHAT